MQFRSNHRKPEVVKLNSKEIVIQKRNDYRENELLRSNHVSTHTVQSYGDRFIPRRYLMLLNENDTIFKLYGKDQEHISDIMNWNLPKNYWLQNYMKDALNKCLSTSVSKNRKLQFTDKAVKYTDKNGNILSLRSMEEKGKMANNDKDWSCNSRSKPFKYSETTHYSVGFDNSVKRNMMDWSINGEVAAIFKKKIIIWKHIRDISTAFSINNANCLKYCPKGKYLALGCKILNHPVIELWVVNKYCTEVKVYRDFFGASQLKINCLEWSECGNFLLSGTSKGNIDVVSAPSLTRIRSVQAHQAPISTMHFSPTMRFLASCDIAGNIVIHHWFSFNVYMNVRCKRQSPNSNVILKWHPWNGVELVIAEQNPAAVVILHVLNKQISAFYRRKDKSIWIHSLTFNKITAEILLSISRTNSNDLKILVLGSLERVVDVLTIKDGAQFLIWDPEGTRVVTAGKDDSVTIWYLHPKTKDRTAKNTADQNQLCSLFKKKLNCRCEYGVEFRLWSTIK